MRTRHSNQLVELRALTAEARSPGTEVARKRQVAQGKLLARERIAYLLDEDSFRELDALTRRRPAGDLDHIALTDGVVTGWGTISGRPVFVYSQDFTISGGSLGEVHGGKIQRLMDLAGRIGAPIIGLCDGGGARIDEGVASLAAYGGIFRRNVQLSGSIPQISVIMGPCAGGAVYSPAITDFVFMVEDTSYMFVTGPSVVRAVTGESVTQRELGGPIAHASHSGACHFVAPDDRSCLDGVRRLLTYLPSSYNDSAPCTPTHDDPRRRCTGLDTLLPEHCDASYEMLDLLREVVDDGQLVEYGARWAPAVICCFARFAGASVGVVANQPRHDGGALSIASAEKAARFVRTCDAFGLPIVTFVDVPGFVTSAEQAHHGLIRHAAKLLFAFCEASVPRIQVVVRKAHGVAFLLMNSRPIGADLSYAWPRADEHDDLTSPYRAEMQTYIDEIIEPADTRRAIIDGLTTLRGKEPRHPPRMHENLPL